MTVNRTEKERMAKDLEQQFLAQQIARAVMERNQGWWRSGGACLTAASAARRFCTASATLSVLIAPESIF